MTGNISYLFKYEPYDGGYVSFGHEGGKITSKGTIKTSKLEFENVYFVKELKYNLFSVSQICDNKYSVLFTDSECLVLGKDFKVDENPVYHSRTKHIDIRHHFIRDCYEKKLINVDHIHTDNNVADLLTKPFDVGRFQYLVAEHVMKRLLWCIKSGITSCCKSYRNL
ncbi:hypothetical protein Tco_1363311 [Tanacetum coccineum]